MSDLGEIERVAGALLRNLSPARRRALLRTMARNIQASQAARVARQQAPDGGRFAPRKSRRDARPGAYPLRFTYPRGDPNARVAHLRSWVREGPLVTGFDLEAGGIRSFHWDRIARWLPAEGRTSGGRVRRRGAIRAKAMFRGLRNRRHLRADATDAEAWIGFAGRAAEIALVHQEGRADRPSRTARAVRYAERALIGLTAGERDRALTLLLDAVAADV